MLFSMILWYDVCIFNCQEKLTIVEYNYRMMVLLNYEYHI